MVLCTCRNLQNIQKYCYLFGGVVLLLPFHTILFIIVCVFLTFFQSLIFVFYFRWMYNPGIKCSAKNLLRILLKIRSPAPQLQFENCLLYTSPSPRDKRQSRMPSSA